MWSRGRVWIAGHIEKDELPDEAAVREVLEETGVEVELVGEKREDVSDPVQLHRPAGVQLENIGPNHQHIDLIYFARPRDSVEIHAAHSEDRVCWYGPEDWDAMSVNAEVRGWCERELFALRGRLEIFPTFVAIAANGPCGNSELMSTSRNGLLLMVIVHNPCPLFYRRSGNLTTGHLPIP